MADAVVDGEAGRFEFIDIDIGVNIVGSHSHTDAILKIVVETCDSRGERNCFQSSRLPGGGTDKAIAIFRFQVGIALDGMAGIEKIKIEFAQAWRTKTACIG